jgi:hypothetical protein
MSNGKPFEDTFMVMLPDCTVQDSAIHLAFHFVAETIVLKMVICCLASRDTINIVETIWNQTGPPAHQQSFISTDKQFEDTQDSHLLVSVNDRINFVYREFSHHFLAPPSKSPPMSTITITRSSFKEIGRDEVTQYKNTVIVNIYNNHHCCGCHLSQMCKGLGRRVGKLFSVSPCRPIFEFYAYLVQSVIRDAIQAVRPTLPTR